MTCITPESRFISIGAALVCLAIGLGAWAAHGLEKTIASQYEGKTKLVAGQTIHESGQPTGALPGALVRGARVAG